ncbi:MAG: DUF3368 domain-containing protein [Chloroflexota bacterium]
MPARTVVVNSTPLVAFWSIGRLDILRDLFGEIAIPPAVRDEFLSAEKEMRRKTLRGVLLLAKEEGMISLVSPLLKALQEVGLYLHDDLVRRVLELAGE